MTNIYFKVEKNAKGSYKLVISAKGIFALVVVATLGILVLISL